MTHTPAGRAIGATADGYIDRPKDQVALKGSLVPAYGLNSVLGNIPLLGDVLVSKKGEGIFGVTYSATGNADQPKIDVNPLSVLTPGILRRIFEGHMPTAANAPSNAPAATPKTPPPAKPCTSSGAAREERFAEGKRNGPVDHFERRTPLSSASGSTSPITIPVSQGRYFFCPCRTMKPPVCGSTSVPPNYLIWIARQFVVYLHALF